MHVIPIALSTWENRFRNHPTSSSHRVYHHLDTTAACLLLLLYFTFNNAANTKPQGVRCQRVNGGPTFMTSSLDLLLLFFFCLPADDARETRRRIAPGRACQLQPSFVYCSHAVSSTEHTMTAGRAKRPATNVSACMWATSHSSYFSR